MKVLVSAGGTGGHLFPALAVIEELRSLLGARDELEVWAVGNPEKIEAKVSKEQGWCFVPIPMVGFSGFGFNFIKFLFKTVKSINILRKLIRQERIDFGIGTGAYITYPAGVALHSEGKPFFLLESNLVPGRANMLLARKSSLFFGTFEESIKYLPPAVVEKYRLVGTPVRKELLTAPTKEEACKKFDLQPDKPTLLIFGGSLGAATLNQVIWENYSFLLDRGYQIIWQVGKNFHNELPEDGSIKIFEFIDDMPSAYASSDLVISRAGASTLAEITALGKPAILVPYPYATA
ncbi:MAG: UDP-N-acetylglucosamine--N-acetylmuramyl-(pentapeptide) pyrophosphoryl-undecaprenol N-acetylglucosamine transferase, partial [Candidatus Kapaibacteriota bacterium]